MDRAAVISRSNMMGIPTIFMTVIFTTFMERMWMNTKSKWTRSIPITARPQRQDILTSMFTVRIAGIPLFPTGIMWIISSKAGCITHTMVIVTTTVR